jgi:hypothetical protein
MGAGLGRHHKMSPARIAQLQRWRQLGAQARRGRHTAQRAQFHQKRAKQGRSVSKAVGKSTAWGLQKMVVPVGLGGPVVAMAKNRLPGYNQFQIVKSTAHKAAKPSRAKKAARKGGRH